MLRWCTYTLLPGPSSHVILNALNLKAFICNRIITAGTVIRFAVSPKRIYSSRTGNVARPSGKSGLSVLQLQHQEHRSETFDTNRDVVQETLPDTSARLQRQRDARRAEFDSYRPRYRRAPCPMAAPWFSFQSKSHTINHMDYKASTAGDCSLFWVLGDENFVSRGRVV